MEEQTERENSLYQRSEIRHACKYFYGSPSVRDLICPIVGSIPPSHWVYSIESIISQNFSLSTRRAPRLISVTTGSNFCARLKKWT